MAQPRRRASCSTARDKQPVRPAASISGVVFHSGTSFVLREDFGGGARYHSHRRRMERLTSFRQVLEELERISKRLQRASRVDKVPPVDERQVARRSQVKGRVLYRRLCIAYDLHTRVPYAQQFLNTLARYNASSKNWRELATRGIRVVDDLLHRSDWRGQGRRAAPAGRSSGKEIEAIRGTLQQIIRPIWRLHNREDISERGEALRLALDRSGLSSIVVPRGEVLKRPPSKVVEFIMAEHLGLGQTKTRISSKPDIELRHR